jgi:hypothetical protein
MTVFVRERSMNSCAATLISDTLELLEARGTGTVLNVQQSANAQAAT